ncbi:MAG: metal-dependent hydrolase [Methanobrevibacter sp.]|uniref:metal-dependent hydrolase n=1 Tax=Methanobrevibacter sp. TaxID=66852 RepID=UPI0026DEDB09|nr:metal-dependent hydrolase [Methanobrevibacter sp.]MDO5848066.1 metal-dependent hydrolase [Methanobrevibacter sp.]
MSSYKGHTIFALILSLLFFQNPILIALTIIGANLPDFDHKFKKEKVYQMIIIGLIIFIGLYIFNLPYYLGLIIVFLGAVFFFSDHRSLTHSIFGLFILTAAVSLILIFSYNLVVNFIAFPKFNHYYVMLLIVILLGFLFLNKKVFLVFLPLLVIGALLLPRGGLDYIQLSFAIFIGILSHIILDCFTPAGIKPLAPLSSRKVHRKFAIVCICLLLPIAILYYFNFGNLFVDLILNSLNTYKIS